ncbi:hypothetical protein [Streptomyces sp. NPDC058701]|uniref:hypothetical protein n=1 Tax=Streptomyces sp. NPDC058701 TaxID=3346608 RepID=UPI0036482730
MEKLLGSSPPALTVGPPRGPEDLAAFSTLYQEVFATLPGDSLTPRLLAALHAHSGLVIGAWEGRRPVGFVYSFLARTRAQEGHRLYQYSQVAAVAADRRGAGVGRALKQAQAGAALASGVDLVRWAFDPLRAANAHFNLDVLGATTHRYAPGYYGDAAAGRDQGLATDRLIVDWELPARARDQRDWPEAPVLPALAGHVVHGAEGRAYVTVPDSWPAPALFQPAEARQLQEEVGQGLSELFTAGYTAVSCRRIRPGTAAYLLVKDVRR